MLLSEATASSIKVLCKRFRDAIPNMTDKELYNCLRILNKSQTEAEKLSASTIDKNGKGFTSNDAEQLTNAIKEYSQNGCFIKFHTRNLVRYRLHKYADQLIRFWIDRTTIKKVKHGEYSYESKAEREARKTAEADAKVAAGAQQFRQQFAASQTPEAKAEERTKQNHGQLDFLNDLM